MLIMNVSETLNNFNIWKGLKLITIYFIHFSSSEPSNEMGRFHHRTTECRREDESPRTFKIAETTKLNVAVHNTWDESSFVLPNCEFSSEFNETHGKAHALLLSLTLTLFCSIAPIRQRDSEPTWAKPAANVSFVTVNSGILWQEELHE